MINHYFWHLIRRSNIHIPYFSSPELTSYLHVVRCSSIGLDEKHEQSSDGDLYVVLQSEVEEEEKYVNNEIASNILSIDQNDSIKLKIELNEMQLKSGKKEK